MHCVWVSVGTIAAKKIFRRKWERFLKKVLSVSYATLTKEEYTIVTQSFLLSSVFASFLRYVSKRTYLNRSI